MDQNKRLGMLWAPFIADAYALGAHWVYDQKHIANSGLNMEGLNYPIAIYHKAKELVILPKLSVKPLDSSMGI